LTIKERRADMRLSVGLALVGIIKPTITISTTAYLLVSNPSISSIDAACKLKGPVDFICTYASMLLVAIVARLRSSVVIGKVVLKLEWATVAIFTAVYCCTVALVACNDEYRASPSGVDCSPSSQTSTSSAMLLSLLGAALFMFSLVALACYANILIYLRRQHRAISKPTVPLLPQHPRILRPVFIRTFAVCSIYIFLIVPASVLILLEALVQLSISKTLSLIISICLALDAAANPCLTLLAHSVIYDHLKAFIYTFFAKARPQP
ncbi:hypothetical protein L0F63_003157, partial [Massospora cicadina]